MKNLLTTKISYQAMAKSRHHKIIPIIEEFAIMSNVAGVDRNGLPPTVVAPCLF
jgi:hypothetical protein